MYPLLFVLMQNALKRPGASSPFTYRSEVVEHKRLNGPRPTLEDVLDRLTVVRKEWRHRQ